MVGKPHRTNSKFQLRYFLAGSCTTPDGAYVLMYGQLNDMQTKLAHADAQLKRRLAKLKAAEAKESRAQAVIDAHINNSGSGLLSDCLQAEADLLEAEAERLEVEADVPTWELNLQAARQELQDIQDIMDELRPQCKFAHLPILEMGEASQEDEWLGELKRRTENFLLTSLTIPHDHFQTMRMHPKFLTEIVPHVQSVQDRMAPVLNYAGQQVPRKWSDTMLEIAQDSRSLMLEAPKE